MRRKYWSHYISGSPTWGELYSLPKCLRGITWVVMGTPGLHLCGGMGELFSVSPGVPIASGEPCRALTELPDKSVKSDFCFHCSWNFLSSFPPSSTPERDQGTFTLTGGHNLRPIPQHELLQCYSYSPLTVILITSIPLVFVPPATKPFLGFFPCSGSWPIKRNGTLAFTGVGPNPISLDLYTNLLLMLSAAPIRIKATALTATRAVCPDHY